VVTFTADPSLSGYTVPQEQALLSALMGIRVVAGRDFTSGGDPAATPQRVVVALRQEN
jgi:hypothetical protein